MSQEKTFNLSIQTIVAIGIGAAVFIILAKFVSIPTPVPNTTVQTSYAFLGLMAVIFGRIAGGFIGFICHAVHDAISYGSVWWSWVLVSGIVGFVIGLSAKRINIQSGVFGVKEIVTFNIYQVIVNIVGWGLIAPTLDILIYVEPENKVYVQGIVAATANIITIAVLGTLLLAAYAKTRSQSDSLSRE